jgi:hypothetical protein
LQEVQSRTRKEDGRALEVYAFFKRRGKYNDYVAFMKQQEQSKLGAQIAKVDSAFVDALAAK